MNQTAFDMNRILCTILLSFYIKTYSPLSAHDSVQFVPMGSTVKLPCDGYGNRTFAKWLYSGEDKNFKIIVQENKGLIFKQTALWPRKRILEDFFLEISHFSELDSGMYVCQVCTYMQICTDGKQISLAVAPQYETSSLLQTHIIIKGGKVSYSCLQDVTLKVGWTFEAHTENTELKSELTNKGLLFIPEVQPSHAGKYNCWRETSSGERHTIYSVNVCVLTVSAGQLTDSPQNCTLYCNMDINAEGNPVIMATENLNISVTGKLKKPKSSVICSLHSSEMGTDGLSHDVTTQSGTTAYITVDCSPLQAATLITAVFLIIIALVILFWVLQQKVNAESRPATRTSEGENDTQVIYSMLEISRLQQQSITTSANECVYSEIKV